MFSFQSRSHEGQVLNEFEGYALSHKGKATDPNNVFSMEDGPEKYTNPNAYEKMAQYTDAARQRYGPDYNPSQQPLDTDLMMRTGGGKQHGTYLIANSAIDPSSVSNLRQIHRADSTTSSDVPIRPRRQTTLETVQVPLVSVVVIWFYTCAFPFPLFKHRECNIAGRASGSPTGDAGPRGGPRGGPSEGDGGPRCVLDEDIQQLGSGHSDPWCCHSSFARSDVRSTTSCHTGDSGEYICLSIVFACAAIM